MIPPVIDRDWLRDHVGDVVLADVRWYLDGRSGRDAYDGGHLPSAVFVDLDRWLASHGGAPEEGRHPLPDPEVFAKGMASLGIGDRDTVIAYDDAGGVIASRLIWMLRATGHEAAVLDGGLGAFDGPLETDLVERDPAAFAARPWPADRLVSIDEVADAASAPGTVVLDARDADRYRGDFEPVDPTGGHVPGAENLPCRGHVAPDGTFLPAGEIRARFAAVGVTEGTDVVSYCGSGVTACHNLIAQEHAGLGVGRLYPGSWSAWSNTSGRPVATGDAAG